MSELRSVKGTRDLLPPETAVWSAVETTARRVFGLFGYREIRTPVLESTELFVRGVGEATDIVGKEMYTFSDRKGRSLTLRPESTAAVVRAFIQHGLQQPALPVRLFYMGPHFRYERPQKGRYRQFSQIGAELLGDAGPHSDAELVSMLVRFLEELGFDDLEVLLNTVGDAASRQSYRKTLVQFLEPHRETLTAESRRRLDSNPLRILDTKNPEERQLLEDAPRLSEHLTAESREHFETVCALLESSGVRSRIEPHLVRGLDYYSKTVFEIVSAQLGAQNAIVGGGRYDGLVAELGGPDLPGIGFAIGEDRLLEVVPESFRRSAEPQAPVVVVPIPPVEVDAANEVVEEIRRHGVPAIVEMSGGTVKAALKKADRRKLRWVALLGEDEVEAKRVALKDLESGEQELVTREELILKLKVAATQDGGVGRVGMEREG